MSMPAVLIRFPWFRINPKARLLVDSTSASF
jgi:hypothetical protein